MQRPATGEGDREVATPGAPAAREPVGTLAVFGQVEPLELGLFGDAQRPK